VVPRCWCSVSWARGDAGTDPAGRSCHPTFAASAFAAAQACGGSGGGKPDMAQAGGKDVTKVDDAIAAAKALAAKAG
jgi:DHHA1 domain